MPHLIVTDDAQAGLERCRRFLAARDPDAAVRAARTIKVKLRLLMTQPGAGRRMRGRPDLRELVI